ADTGKTSGEFVCLHESTGPKTFFKSLGGNELKLLRRPFPEFVEDFFLEPGRRFDGLHGVPGRVGQRLQSVQLGLRLGIRLEPPGVALGQLAVDGAMNVSPGGHRACSFCAFSRQYVSTAGASRPRSNSRARYARTRTVSALTFVIAATSKYSI